MQASESKGTLDSVCWEAAHVHPIRCRTAWEGVFLVFFFFSCRIPRGVSPCALQKCVWIMGRRLGLSEEGD